MIDYYKLFIKIIFFTIYIKRVYIMVIRHSLNYIDINLVNFVDEKLSIFFFKRIAINKY